MTRGQWNEVLYELENCYCKPLRALDDLSLILCQISQHLQDPRLTKSLGQFIEINKNKFFSKIRKFDLRLY